MRRLGIFGAIAVLALAANGVCAQTATTAPAGKPLALLAGLPPPHAAKHKETRHLAHATAAHAKHEKIAGRSHHSRLAAHSRHASAATLAARHHSHHDAAVTASAFAEEPPPQASPTPSAVPAPNWPVVNATPPNDTAAPVEDSAAAPTTTSAPANAGAAGVYPDPSAAKVETIKITAANAASLNASNNAPVASAAMANTSSAAAAAPSQTVLAAPVVESASQEPAGRTDVGSASWIAQVLAALGGAVAAGVVAWFLIGSGPIRTYG